MEINNPLPSLISSLYQENKDLGKGFEASKTSDSDSLLSNRSASRSSQELSLSVRSQKLSAISKEFFNGPIASKNIAALSQSLYENGFINGKDLQTLGGDQPKQNSITESQHFVNSFMLEASEQGDTQTLAMLTPIAAAISNMDAPSSQSQRQTEIIALDNAKQVLNHLKELDTDDALIKEFENVVEVLTTLDSLRKNDANQPGTAKYNEVQNNYDDLFKPSETT